MKTLAVLTIVQLFCRFSQAYILPLETILQKNAALAGNSIINVEQEVIFKDAYKEVAIKESWLIEGDRNLKVSARGMGELKDVFSWAAVYNNKNKTSLSGKSRINHPVSEDFFERYPVIKSKDSFMTYLKELGIDTNVRLSRAGGAVCFAVGEPAKSMVPNREPEVWFDQDSFRVAKIRFPSNAEVEFSDYAVFNNIHYPRKKIISWGGKTVTIKIQKVLTKTGAGIKTFYPESLEQPTDMQLTRLGVLGQQIDEFYKRFR